MEREAGLGRACRGNWNKPDVADDVAGLATRRCFRIPVVLRIVERDLRSQNGWEAICEDPLEPCHV